MSQFSFLEIAIKQRIGKLPELPIDHLQILSNIMKSDYSILSIEDQHISNYQKIPWLTDHRDPFDRFLLATALAENIPIITSDEKFKGYQPFVKVILNSQEV